MGEDVQRRSGVGIGDDDHPCPRQPRGQQHFAARGIAEHHALSGCGGLANALRIVVERDEGYALAVKQTREVLAAAPVTADQHMLFSSHRLHRDVVQLHGAVHPLAGTPAPHDNLAAFDHERCDQHRQHHRRQHRLQHVLLQQAAARGMGQQHETELATSSQRKSGAQRHPAGRTKQPAQPENQHGFHQHQRHQQHGDPGVLDNHAHVEQHADGHEKQAEQHVAERLDVLLDLVTVLGLGNQHAGDKCSKRQRQPRQFGQISDAQGHQQHVENEQLRRFLTGNHMKPGAHHTLADHKQHRQHDYGFRHRQPEGAREVLGRCTQRRNQDQQRHHGKVLEQQDADDLPAMRRIQFKALGEQLGEDGGRGHGQRAAKDNSPLPGDTHRQRNAQHQQQRHQHLGRPEPEHDAAHGHKPRQAELQTNAEHQEHHADFREVRHLVSGRDPAEGIGADRHPDDQVTKQGR